MILAIIPARSGSKSIKNKNIVLLSGKPLISYSIKTALACKQIDKVIVSTDSPKIAEIARSYGAEIPFLRPKNLATNTSPAILAYHHAVSFFEAKGEKIKKIIILHPTSPFRRIKDIKKSFQMIKLSGTDSVVSVCKAEHNPYYVMKKVRNNYLSDLFNRKKIYARQQAPNVYRINGSLYVAKRDIIMQKKVVTSKTRPLIMPHEFSVDIDSHLDLQYAEFLLKNSKRIQNSS